MGGNSLGKTISMTSFGESHGPAVGVVLDGIPPKLAFSQEDLQRALDARAPGRSEGTTARREPDRAQVLSGIFRGVTLGTPIAVVVANVGQKPEDYAALEHRERPGHGDRTYRLKYGIRDHRGGGRASGRETVARVIAGYFAGLVIEGTTVKAYASQIGPFSYESIPKAPTAAAPYHFPDSSQNDAITRYLSELRHKGESCGGAIKAVVDRCPPGLGEPVFDKLKADLSKALLSIGGCVSFSLGIGAKASRMEGTAMEEGHFGGIEGGISNGGRLVLEAAFKPPSSVGETARAGRHDPCIVPRACAVVEAMVKFVLADHYLRQKAYHG